MPIRFVAVIAIVALLAGCGGRPIGVMTPTGQTVAGTTPVNLLVATTRAPSENPAVLFGAYESAMPSRVSCPLGCVPWFP